MKKLYIIRHAKSSWALPGQSDFIRPLNDRGLRDAPHMALRLLTKEKNISLFLSSPALRARQTCEAFVEAYHRDKSSIQFEEKLYHAPASMFYKVIQQQDNAHESIAVFSHNPGITDFVNSLEAGARIDNMPTCGIFAIAIDADSWSEMQEAKKSFLFFDYPKQGK